MATRTTALPEGTPTAVVAGALAAAALVGALMTLSVPAGLAALIGVCYAPLVLINLRLGLVLWVPLTFLEALPLFNAGGKAAGLLIALAWVGMGRALAPRLGALVTRHRLVIACLLGYIVWITLSLAWAASPSAVARDLWHWYALLLVFVIVATVAREPRAVRLVMHAFIVGGVLSILAGEIYGSGSANLDLAAAESGRLYGAQGDPNILAAGLIPAIVFAGALLANARGFAVRAWLVVAAGVLTVGVAASESRGGLVAAGATLLAALVFFRRRRAHVLVVVLAIAGLGGVAFASTPGAWDRVIHFSDGSGRSDIWRVAMRVGEAHPIAGAGLNNFETVSAQYVRRPGALKTLDLIVDRPHVAHNLYLEAYADTGIIGLLLFVGFIAACLYAAWSAGRRFDRLGYRQLETLATAVLVGGIGFLSAAMFISAGVDKRLWVLLALGPALNVYAIATERRRLQPATPAPVPAGELPVAA
jgi:O-antigen ligase